MKKALKRLISTLLLAAVLAMGCAGTVLAQDLVYTTNGAQNSYAAGSALVLYGKVTEENIPKSNLSIIIDIKDSSAQVIYYGQVKTDNSGYFRTNFTVPNGASGVMTIKITTNEGAKVNATYNLATATDNVVVQGTIANGSLSENVTVTIPASTRQLGIVFQSNVNYFNNRSNNLDLATLGLNTNNEDCFTLYEKTSSGYTEIGSRVILSQDTSGTVSGITYFSNISVAEQKNQRRNVIYVAPTSALKGQTLYKLVIDGDLSSNSSSTLGSSLAVYFKTGVESGGGGGVITVVKPQTTVSGSTVSMVLNDNQISDALKKAKEGQSNTFVLSVDETALTSGSEVKMVDLRLSSQQVSNMNQGIDNLVCQTPLGSISVPVDELQDTNGEVSISLQKVEGQADTYQVTISDTSGAIRSYTQRLQINLYVSGSSANVVTHNGKIMKNAVVGNGTMSLVTTGLSTFATAQKQVNFTDITNHWAKANIEFLAVRDVVNGVSATTFAPNSKVTRAEFVKMLVNSLDELSVAGTASQGFKDVADGKWYSEYINWAAANKVVNGQGENSFGTNNYISRQDMAVMIARFAEQMDIELTAVTDEVSFADDQAIAAYAKSAVYQMQQAGLINGVGDNKFNPTGNATRAEVAKMINLMIEKLIAAA